MFGLAYSASSLRPPDRKLARVHVWLHHVCGAAQNPPPPVPAATGPDNDGTTVESPLRAAQHSAWRLK